jgi:cell division protein FtsI (penicillin-binding protein 3)
MASGPNSSFRSGPVRIDAGAAASPRAFRRRVRVVAWGFALGFALIAGRLADLAAFPPAEPGPVIEAAKQFGRARPDLLDRNGTILATDIEVASLFADPARIGDAEDTVDQLALLLPDLDRAAVVKRLKSDKRFEWIKRGLTPRQKAEVHNLGLPGLGFVNETRRVYPAGRTMSHVIGHVNVDNVGMAGMEKYVDDQEMAKRFGLTGPAKPGPITLSVDLRVEHAMRNELVRAMETYKAKAAAGIILDARTGEVMALSSLPDYDPQNPKEALEPDRINRIAKGVFELGSTFKAFTVAMALDTGTSTLETVYDARSAIRVGRYSIGDYHAKSRYLTLTEIFVYSSNIGAAKMALDVGMEGHQAFLKRIGMLDRIKTELPETAEPLVPKPWLPISTMTIAFGHGLGVTPLHAAVASAALVNGGRLMPPTFLKRTAAEADMFARQVIEPDTSRELRYLMRLNVEKGTARRAAVKGYRVGGKTGTAEKAGPNGYDRNKLLTTFIAAFPSEDPAYVAIVLLDEPKGSKETYGYATSGWNAAPTMANIIARVGPMLGVAPDNEMDELGAVFLLAAN